jgi:gliding motility-associated-like protein
MPNAFTPNNDGLNDCFGLKYGGPNDKVEFSIYNRWGERIFFSTNPLACWDGIYKGVPQEIGVYVFIIKREGPCGSESEKGLFTLIR